MAITVNRLNGQTVTMEPCPGSCREVLTRNQMLNDPSGDQTIIADDHKNRVDNQPFASFDGKNLTVLPEKVIGGI